MGEIDEAVARVAEAIRARGAVPPDVIIGLEQLRGSLGRWLSATGKGLYAPTHGRWFVSPSGTQVDLSRRGSMRAVFEALVRRRLERPGHPITSAELIAAGWPEDPTPSEASANRLRVTLCRLRQLGLDTALVTTSTGWMLNPAVSVVREAQTHLEEEELSAVPLAS
jgi:hypothetical protein